MESLRAQGGEVAGGVRARADRVRWAHPPPIVFDDVTATASTLHRSLTRPTDGCRRRRARLDQGHRRRWRPPPRRRQRRCRSRRERSPRTVAGRLDYLLSANLPWFGWAATSGAARRRAGSATGDECAIRPVLDAAPQPAESSMVAVPQYSSPSAQPGLPAGSSPTSTTRIEHSAQLAERSDVSYVFTLFSGQPTSRSVADDGGRARG
jgi:hypothetical protein